RVYETAVRGGFGIFYDLGVGGAAGQVFGSGFPYTKVVTLSGVAFPLDAALAVPPALNFNPPFGLIYAFDPNLELPYTYQWNFAVDQSVGTHQTISASYVAAIGRRLLRVEQLSNPNPNFTLVEITRNKAVSNYQAMQLQFDRRLTRGLQALA